MNVLADIVSTRGQGWEQIGQLALALVLSTVIGVEREVRHKSAGLRTHTLVGLGSALFMLISKYGFFDVIGTDVNLDPSRIAAQVVTGIGFIGGGVIFVRRDIVRGLTTASVVWLTAAVGMACGSGLVILAVVVTAGHLIVVYAYPYLARLVPGGKQHTTALRLRYADGTNALSTALAECTHRGFVVEDVELTRSAFEDEGVTTSEVVLRLHGTGSSGSLIAAIADVRGIRGFDLGAFEEPSE